MKVLGHSPDFILSLIYRFAVDKGYTRIRPKRHVK